MLFLSLLMNVFLNPSVWAKEIILNPGETKPVPAHGKAWVEKSKVLQLQDRGSSFVLKGLKPGTSLLKVGKDSYDVSVLSPSQEKAYRLLKPAVEKSLNLELSLSDGKVRVKGHLIRWADWEKLYRACQSKDCDYSMEATMDPSLKSSAQKKIGHFFQQHGLPPQNLMFDEQIQALVSAKGEVSAQSTKILKAFGILPIQSSSNLDLEPMVKVQITVAEVKKAETLNYGIKWPPSYEAQILPSYVQNSKALLDIHFLESHGLAKVLASPNILCRSGKDANFFAGGEFPIKILNYKIQDIVWRKYGIQLKVKPQADYSGKMSISLETEVSSIDKANGIDGIPALYSNKIQSHFDLNESRIIALSGLIKNEQAQQSDGLPGLSRLPVLGALFSSKDFSDNRTELVVFVKPEVISPGTLEAKQ
jgi:pilus assembly protein CpaC